MIIGTSKDTTTTRVYEQGQHGASFALRDFPDFATRWRSTRGSDGTRTRTLLRDRQAFWSPSQMIQIHCAKTVPEANDFNPFELPLSEKQIPRFVGNVSSYEK